MQTKQVNSAVNISIIRAAIYL